MCKYWQYLYTTIQYLCIFYYLVINRYDRKTSSLLLEFILTLFFTVTCVFSVLSMLLLCALECAFSVCKSGGSCAAWNSPTTPTIKLSDRRGHANLPILICAWRYKFVTDCLFSFQPVWHCQNRSGVTL